MPNLLTLEDLQKILSLISYGDDHSDYAFEAIEDNENLFIRAFYNERDVVTGKLETQYTRKWHIEYDNELGQVVQTAFKCVLTSIEHRVREHFLYRGRNIFGPHFDLDHLWELVGPQNHECDVDQAS